MQLLILPVQGLRSLNFLLQNALPVLPAAGRQALHSAVRDEAEDEGTYPASSSWEDEGAMPISYNRACDLKAHSIRKHMKENDRVGLSEDSLFSENNCFWMVYHPADYRAFVKPSSSTSKAATRTQQLVIEWFRATTCRPRWNVAAWQSGWEERAVRLPEVKDPPYSPETPKVPQLAVKSVCLTSGDVTAWFKESTRYYLVKIEAAYCWMRRPFWVSPGRWRSWQKRKPLSTATQTSLVPSLVQSGKGLRQLKALTRGLSEAYGRETKWSRQVDIHQKLEKTRRWNRN